jgi:endonuclease G, mitochondrial
MTNYHVIPTATVAKATKIEFNYQYAFGADAQLGEPVRYELAPDALFRTSEKLDYTVVAVAPPDAGRPPLESGGCCASTRTPTRSRRSTW